MLFLPSWFCSSKSKAELTDSLQIPGRSDSEKFGHMLDLLCEPVRWKSKIHCQETLHKNKQSENPYNDYFVFRNST